MLLGIHGENVGVRGQTTVRRQMPIPDCFGLFLQAHFLSLPPYMLSSLPFLGAPALTFLWPQTQSVCRLAWCRLLPWQPVNTNSHHFHMLELKTPLKQKGLLFCLNTHTHHPFPWFSGLEKQTGSVLMFSLANKVQAALITVHTTVSDISGMPVTRGMDTSSMHIFLKGIVP